MPDYIFTSPEGKKYHASGDNPDAAFASARPITDEEIAKEFAAEKGMKFEPLTKTRSEYLSEIPGKVAESLLPLSATGPSDQAKQEFHHWQEDKLKATGYAPFAPWEHGGNPVLGAVELGASLPLGAGAKAAAAGASKVLPAMAGTFFKGRPVPYGFWSDAEAVNLIRKRISEGATRKQIHEEFGQGALDVMKRLKIGTENRRGRPNPPDELLDEIDRLAAEGKMTWREIGEAVGLKGDPRNAFHLSRRRALRAGEEVGSSGEAPQVSKWVTDPATGVRSRVSSSDPQALMRALQASQRPKGDPLKAGGPLASPDDVLEKRAVSAGGKKSMPLERDVLERGRSGRPIATEPLATGTEDAILQRGFDKNAVFAYHASPHDFEKFDLSKMGTGQGAQSYGAGHYLAESPEVSGRGGAYDKEFSGKQLNDLNPAQRTAGHLLIELNGDRDAAYRSAIDGARTYQGASRGKLFVEAAELIKSGWEPPKAKIYETVIKAPPERFLDWDRPMTEQSEHVRNALSNTDKSRLLKEWSQTPDWGGARGQQAYEQVADRLGKDVASEHFKQLGIPGIKYLDEKSRRTYDELELMRMVDYWKKSSSPDAPQRLKEVEASLEKERNKPKTRNFVVFDDKTIDVLKKYAPPGVATGGGAAAALEAGGDDPLVAK